MSARLFLVCDDQAMGDNSDLFVLATDPQQAASLWRAHYELEDDQVPERIMEVPAATGPARAIGWDEVTQHKRPCPGNRHRDAGRGTCADCGQAI